MRKSIIALVLVASVLPHIALAGGFFSNPAGPAIFSAQQAQDQGIVRCSGINDCDLQALGYTIAAVVDLLLQIAIAVGVIVIAYAGFLYLTSAGNASQVSKAHRLFGYAVVGLLASLAAWLIIEALVNTLVLKGRFNPFTGGLDGLNVGE